MQAQGGFTLIELLMVIAIMAMMMSLVAPNWRGGGKDDINVVARTLKADLRYARSIAISKGKPVQLTFDFASRQYAVTNRSTQRQIPEAITMSLTLDRADITKQAGQIHFYPDGSSSGGVIAMHKGDNKLKITTTWFNGAVTLEQM